MEDRERNVNRFFILFYLIRKKNLYFFLISCIKNRYSIDSLTKNEKKTEKLYKNLLYYYYIIIY